MIKMKLNKTSQKIDNNICKALTIACESSLHEVPGFAWLTHRANYTNFPASLVITCVFELESDFTSPDWLECHYSIGLNIVGLNCLNETLKKIFVNNFLLNISFFSVC